MNLEILMSFPTKGMLVISELCEDFGLESRNDLEEIRDEIEDKLDVTLVRVKNELGVHGADREKVVAMTEHYWTRVHGEEHEEPIY